jgi:hypothetical protein
VTGEPSNVAFLYLDVDDEITSAVARIRAATEAKVALVLPYGSRVATSRINFRLLAREAEVQGRGLVVVAPDAAARALAAAAGLTVHPSVSAFEAAERGEAPPTGDGARAADDSDAVDPDAPTVLFPALAASEPSKASVRRSRKARASATLPGPRETSPIPRLGPTLPVLAPRTVAIGLAVLFVVLLVGGVAAFNYLPTATITLKPETSVVGPLELVVTADPNATEPDSQGLVVPAQTFTYAVAATQTFDATGVRIDEATAAGRVTFRNCDTGGSVRIPAGSFVRTEGGVVFATTDTIRVDRAFPFLACPTKDVDVVALLPGPGGNVAAGTITVIPEGYDSVVVSVTNQNPTSGGKHDEFPVIEQKDVDAAMAALTTALSADFDAKLADTSQVPEGTNLFLETKVLGAGAPSTDPKALVGKEQETFELGLTATGTVLGVDPAPLDEIAMTHIQDAVEPGFTLVVDSIQITPGDPVADASGIRYPLTVRARQTRDVDTDALIGAIKGKPLHEARLVLDEVGTSTIAVWPDWVTTIPTMDGKVTITVQGADAGASASPGASPSP